MSQPDKWVPVYKRKAVPTPISAPIPKSTPAFDAFVHLRKVEPLFRAFIEDDEAASSPVAVAVFLVDISPVMVSILQLSQSIFLILAIPDGTP